MATNVINSAWSLTINNGELQVAWSDTLQADQTGSRAHDTVQDIGTSAGGEALVVPADIGTYGVGFVHNQDSTNYVEIGIQNGGTFYPAFRVNAGESYPLRWAQGITLYARANTASVKLRFGVAEA